MKMRLNNSGAYVLYGTIFALCFFVFFFITKEKKSGGRKNDILCIAIFQTATHPSLAAAERGFIEQLERREQKINFISFNAEGSLIAAHAIAQKIAADNDIALFYTIGSLATQALALIEQKRPIIFSAVSEPYNLGIKKLDESNVCGLSDAISSKHIVHFIKTIMPMTRRIGFLRSTQSFNENESTHIKKELLSQNIFSEDLVISGEADIDGLLKSYKVSQLDLVFSPADNIVASATSLINNIMIQQKKPFLTSFFDVNALASIGIDYKESGKKAADIAAIILSQNKSPSQVGILYEDINKIFINKNVSQSINFDLSAEQLDSIVFI